MVDLKGAAIFLEDRERVVNELADHLRELGHGVETATTGGAGQVRPWVWGLRTAGCTIRARFRRGHWRFELDEGDTASAPGWASASALVFGGSRDVAESAETISNWLGEQPDRPIFVSVHPDVEDG